MNGVPRLSLFSDDCLEPGGEDSLSDHNKRRVSHVFSHRDRENHCRGWKTDEQMIWYDDIKLFGGVHITLTGVVRFPESTSLCTALNLDQCDFSIESE